MYFKKATSGENHILWYILGFFTVCFAYLFLGQIPLFLVQWYKVKSDKSIGGDDVEKFFETMDFTLLNINTNIGLILLITVFIFAMLALMLVVKYFHKRPFKFLITPNKKINYKKIFWAFGFWFIMGVIFEGIIALIYPETYYLNFKPLSWLFLLVICIVLLPIQTSFEELFLRGYLMPGISLLTKEKLLPLFITSVFFGLIHSMNPEVEKFGFWTMQIYYVGAGLFLGLITILDDSLELALGVHAATNIFGAAFFSYNGSVLQTDSIVKSTEINPYIMIATFMLGAVIFIFVSNKKYKWNGMSRLFQPIGQEAIANNSKDSHLDTIDTDS